MLFNIYPADFLAIKILTHGDANAVSGKHRFRILLVVFTVVMVTPAVVVGKITLVDKVHPAARSHVSCHTVNPALVHKCAKVDAPRNHICTRHRIVDTVMFKDVASVDRVIPLTTDYPVGTVAGKDDVIVIRGG